ncbi:MAG: prolipoprotein diacylglyceryl transferase [Anaerolineaceae bacterium]
MRVGFSIGPLFVHYYGVIIMLGVLAAAWLATREAKRRSVDPELIWDMLPWLLIAGIIGARIWHILTPPASMVAVGITTQYYLTHPLDAIAIWNGGLGIPGAVMGGAIALIIYARNKKTSFWLFADIIAPGLALAQAIGRWGNFVNQELYGAPTNLPWAIFIEPAYRLPEYKDVAYYHPMFLYESLWNLLLMAFLLVIGRKFAAKLKTGDIFLMYLVGYPLERFMLEFIRLDPSNVGGINANQTLMAVIALSSAAVLIYKHFIMRSSPPPELTTLNSQEDHGKE